MTGVSSMGMFQTAPSFGMEKDLPMSGPLSGAVAGDKSALGEDIGETIKCLSTKVTGVEGHASEQQGAGPTMNSPVPQAPVGAGAGIHQSGQSMWSASR